MEIARQQESGVVRILDEEVYRNFGEVNNEEV